MKDCFIVEQKPFLGLLASMQPICTKRTTLDATTYIHVHVGHKELVLKSTDLEISLQASYPLSNCTISEARSFLVSGKRIFDLVKELEGDIEFTISKQQLSLKAQKVTVSLNIRDAQDFPPFPERIENLMHLDGSFVLSLLGKVCFLIPQNNSNPALNGLYLEIGPDGLKMTTTDGHCLAQITTDQYTLEQEKKWLLPRRAIFEIKKLLENAKDTGLFLGLCGNQLVFSSDFFNFFTKLLADPFPQYETILSTKGFRAATVDRSGLVKTLRRSACLLSGQFIATEFMFGQEELHVSMQNNDVGTLKEKLTLGEYAGENLDIRFYAPYLLSGLQAFTDDAVRFHLESDAKPIIFESNNKNVHLRYLVMPVSPSTA